MASREAPVRAHQPVRTDEARAGRGTQAPPQTGRCFGAAAQLAAVHGTLRRGPVVQRQLAAEASLRGAASAGRSVQVVQRQLRRVQGQPYFVDSRDGTLSQFEPEDPAVLQGGGNAAPTGTYVWDDGAGGRHQYHYDAATRQFLVLAAPGTYWDPQSGRNLERQERNAENGQPIHIYVPAGTNRAQRQNRRRYRLDTYRYEAVPTNRVQWIDSDGRYVDQYERVLTPDGQLVDKQYAVTKQDRDFVIPFKALGQNFLPGLPNLFGGNIDPGETADQALGREIREESGDQLDLGAIVGPRAVAVSEGKRHTIRDATVAAAQAPALAPQGQAQAAPEMAGMFRVTASAFVGHIGTPDEIKQRLLALFHQHLAPDPAVAIPDPALAPYAQHVENLPQDARDAWMQSHSIGALAARIAEDTGAYLQGRDEARAQQPAPQPAASLDRQQGFQMYALGVAEARAGQAAGHADEPAYGTGHQDYLDGLAATEAGLPHGGHAGSVAAAQDYQAGLAAATGGPAHGGHPASVAAFQDYQTGHADGLAGNPQVNQHPAYLLGHGDGVVAAQAAAAQAAAAQADEQPRKRQKI